MKLNLKIRLLRHLKGLGQQQMAEKLNISIADYSKIEAGRFEAYDVVFEKMIALFDLGREQFSVWSDDISNNQVKSLPGLIITVAIFQRAETWIVYGLSKPFS